jgi:hypothetical protein
MLRKILNTFFGKKPQIVVPNEVNTVADSSEVLPDPSFLQKNEFVAPNTNRDVKKTVVPIYTGNPFKKPVN